MLPAGDRVRGYFQDRARSRSDGHRARDHSAQSGGDRFAARLRARNSRERSMRLKKRIVILPGDGIGPEVTRAAVSVWQECAREFGHHFDVAEMPIGGEAIDKTGEPLPPETLEECRKADAVFLGAVGGPKWDTLPVGKRPETGLLA